MAIAAKLESIVYLDGEKIVEFYGFGDYRNKGECFVDLVDDAGIMEYDGRRFEVRGSVSLRGDVNVYHFSTVKG
jgi:hypothetical protein